VVNATSRPFTPEKQKYIGNKVLIAADIKERYNLAVYCHARKFCKPLKKETGFHCFRLWNLKGLIEGEKLF
jgi:hypothetical protein